MAVSFSQGKKARTRNRARSKDEKTAKPTASESGLGFDRRRPEIRDQR